jgi:hypothetical protein
VQIQAKPLEEKGEKPLRVSQAPAWQANGHALAVLFEGQYRKAKAKGECPNTKVAVLIDGKSAASIFYLCQTEKCDVHNRVTRYQPTLQEQAQRKKEALGERVERQSRVRILEAIRKKLPEVLSRPDLEMVALDYFRRLGLVMFGRSRESRSREVAGRRNWPEAVPRKMCSEKAKMCRSS